jgi:hypothetical protein
MANTSQRDGRRDRRGKICERSLPQAPETMAFPPDAPEGPKLRRKTSRPLLQLAVSEEWLTDAWEARRTKKQPTCLLSSSCLTPQEAHRQPALCRPHLVVGGVGGRRCVPPSNLPLADRPSLSFTAAHTPPTCASLTCPVPVAADSPRTPQVGDDDLRRSPSPIPARLRHSLAKYTP